MKKLITLTLCCFAGGALYAQETVAASGGDLSGSGGSASYTVGQVAYTPASDTSYSVYAGVQQPYDAEIIDGFEETEIQLILSAYPNPTTDVLTLEIDPMFYQEAPNAQLAYELIDLQGKVVQREQITGTRQVLDMANLDPAIYFLTVTNNGESTKTFRIIKN